MAGGYVPTLVQSMECCLVQAVAHFVIIVDENDNGGRQQQNDATTRHQLEVQATVTSSQRQARIMSARIAP